MSEENTDSDNKDTANSQPDNSAASVIKLVSNHGYQRPVAPDCLTEDQAAIWNEVVEALKADWFKPETHSQLILYCQHTDAAFKAEQMRAVIMDNFTLDQIVLDDAKLNALNKISAIANRESAKAVSIATKLRITKQSTATKKTQKEADIQKKPWESKKS